MNFKLPGLQSGGIEHVFHQPYHMLYLGTYYLDLFALDNPQFTKHSLFEHLNVAVYHSYRSSKLVRRCGNELGLHFVILFQLIVGIFQLDIRIP